MPYIGQQPAPKVVTSSDLADDVVTADKIGDTAISGFSALGATPADTDELLVSDAGTLKRVDFSHLKGGGAFEHLITTQISSDTANVIFNNTYITTTYVDYKIIISGLGPNVAGNNAKLQMNISSDNGSNFLTATNYNYGNQNERADGSERTQENQTDSSFKLNTDGIGEDSTGSFIIDIFDPLNVTSDRKYFQYCSRSITRDGASGDTNSATGGGMYKDGLTTPFDAIKLSLTAGSFDSGYFSLYGRKIS